MKNKTGLNKNIWKLASTTLMILMLFSTLASAKVDVQVIQEDDNVKFYVKNVEASSTDVLNALTVIDAEGKTAYISQKLSSAEVLRLISGTTYTFDWNIENVEEGAYTAKIYQGDNKKYLTGLSFPVKIEKKAAKPVLSTDKKSYDSGDDVEVTFMNLGKGIIYANVNKWEIANLITGHVEVVYYMSRDCTYGYGGCVDSFELLRFKNYIKQTWDQKDFEGHQVAPGNYLVTAEYSEDVSGFDKKSISTKMFFIRPHRSDTKKE